MNITAENMSEELIKSIIKRLEVIIAILLQRPNHEGAISTLREQVWLLHEAGLKPKEIAQLLGKSNTYVNKELTGLRKSKTGD